MNLVLPDHRSVMVHGRVDGCIGNRLIDWKTGKKPLAERYFDSFQWRLYLLACPWADDFEFHMLKMVKLRYQNTFRASMLESHCFIVMTGSNQIAKMQLPNFATLPDR